MFTATYTSYHNQLGHDVVMIPSRIILLILTLRLIKYSSPHLIMLLLKNTFEKKPEKALEYRDKYLSLQAKLIGE
jgi:hypothetical protein